MKEEQILVRITGQDRPGLTAAVMGILAKYDAKFPDKQLLDKLIFVTLNEAVAKINAQRKFNALAGEVRALQAETDAYLTTLKEK